MPQQNTSPSEKTTVRLLSLITFGLIFILLTRTPIDADLWWHLRAGQTMWLNKQIYLKDIFSYTQNGTTWINAFWISELLLYLLQSAGGYFAVVLFVSLTGATTFYLIFCRLNNNIFMGCFIIILATLTAAPIWGPRPQILSFLLIAFLDYWLAKANPQHRRAWLLIPLFALWANIHGGWIWGFLLLIAQIAGELVQSFLQEDKANKTQLWINASKLFGWTLLTVLAIGINPNGFAIWKLPFQQVNVSMQIQEWLSPDFHRIDFHPFLWMIFLLLLTGPFGRKSINWAQLFKVLGFAYLTFVAQRNIALFAIVAAPLLSEWADAAWEQLKPKKTLLVNQELSPILRNVLNTAILILLILVAVGRVYLVSRPAIVDENYPSGAIEWIKANRPEGNLFNSYNWGGYILWKLPEYPVFIDGRADMYGNDIITQWQTVVNANKNADEILDNWNVNMVLVEPWWPIVNQLEREGWNPAYQDDKSIILIRK